MSADEKPQRRWGWLLQCAAYAIVLSATYQYGQHIGYRAGSLDARDAFMCVMDRVSAQPIGKGASDYCQRVAGSREARHAD